MLSFFLGLQKVGEKYLKKSLYENYRARKIPKKKYLVPEILLNMEQAKTKDQGTENRLKSLCEKYLEPEKETQHMTGKI